MTLTLTITGADRLDNGSPASFTLDRRDGVIGRSPSSDWSLPDPRQFLSSRHCEVRFQDGNYWLSDVSTNGTLLNGAGQRMSGPRRVENGDRFQLGHYEIVASLIGGAAATRDSAAMSGGWNGAVATDSAWDLPARGQMPSSTWDAPSSASPWPPAPAQPTSPSPSPPVRAAAWDPVQPDPNWPSVTPASSAPSPQADVWDKIAGDNAIDWARGGFGAPTDGAGTGMPTARPAAPGADDAGQIVEALAAAAGLKPGQIKGREPDVIDRAGALLKHLVTGLVVLVEARARAKSQLGAEATSISFDGNNPIKLARTPEQALAQLLNPKERGFMEAGPAVEDAFHDLQSHQMATLKAMQGALRATLDRFSPTAIRARAESKGLLGRIMPGAREAALWQAYEREFGGVAQGSDEAFIDVFAKEFRKAYQDQTSAARQR